MKPEPSLEVRLWRVRDVPHALQLSPRPYDRRSGSGSAASGSLDGFEAVQGELGIGAGSSAALKSNLTRVRAESGANLLCTVNLTKHSRREAWSF
jgi:hypothetical protein